MIHGTVHGITPEPFLWGMDRKGMEGISLLHSSYLTTARVDAGCRQAIGGQSCQ